MTAEESDFGPALENSIQQIQERANQINDIDLKPVEVEIQRSERLEEILSDESKLHDLENNYQAANREKTRLPTKFNDLPNCEMPFRI